MRLTLGIQKESSVEERTIVILDPVSVPITKKIALSPRRKDIAGMKVAVVDNTKPNFNIFMDRIQELLMSRYKVASVSRYRKPGRTVGVSHAMLQEIKESCDIAITGLGD
jgi:hypothetical protein